MSTKVKQVAILGGRGYVGSEIIKILNNHDHFYLSKVFSSSAAGTLVDIYSKDKSLKYEQLNINIDLSNIDFVILASLLTDLSAVFCVSKKLENSESSILISSSASK